MIYYGCFGDLVTVYGKVNNIKDLRGNENEFVKPFDSTSQAKAPRQHAASSGSSEGDAFFHLKTLIAV